MRARFIPRDQLRLLIWLIVEEQPEKENLIFRAGLRHADAKDTLGHCTAFGGLAWQKSKCFHPCRRVLRFGIARRGLAQVKPGAFGDWLRDHIRHISGKRQAVAESVLRAYAGNRSEEDRKNNAS